MPDDEPTTIPLRPGPRRRFSLRTLTTRTVLASCLAALVSVLVTAAIAFPWAVRQSNNATRTALAHTAAVAADLFVARPNATVQERFAKEMRKQGIEVWLVRNGVADHPDLPARFVTAITNGQEVTGGSAIINGHLSFVEGRPFADRSGSGMVLAERATTGFGGTGLARLWIALIAGLLAGFLAGGLLARRIAKPIRNAAAAAARLSSGDRSVVLVPEPPTETEDLAHAINGLAAALATSEGRQRDFLLSVSHELRTPLTTIKGYAEALADGVVGAEGAPRVGQTMLTEAGNLERLVDDLLALARLEAADFPLSIITVDLAMLVGSAIEAWSGRCAAVGVELRQELPGVPVLVDTDPGRIRQVIDGLVENALRVVPTGAPVVLGLYPMRPPGCATIEIRDGGPGFSDSDLSMVFERGAMYERYRGVRKVGSGLGLALAAGLVRRLGGAIDVSHAPEGGARFRVVLPVRPYQARTRY
jgi:two-component system sensor histidine kinase BaeS